MTAPEQMLKPCPFCGGEAKQGGNAISPDGYFCACQKCGVYVDGYTDIPTAIAAWNTHPATDELVEALEKYRRFAGETAGKCLGLAMSTDHPEPDTVLMGIFEASQALAAETRTALRNTGAAL